MLSLFKGSLDSVRDQQIESKRVVLLSQLEYHQWLEPSSKDLNLIENAVTYAKKKTPKNIMHSYLDVYSSKNCINKAFDTYKAYVLQKIEEADRDALPCLIRKFSRVSRLLYVFSTKEDEDFYFKILNYLISKQCEDPSLVIHIWESFCISPSARISIFERLIGENRRPDAVKMLEYILEMARSGRFNFWGIWGIEPTMRTLPICPTTIALFKADTEQMVLLMKYGFKLISPRWEAYHDILIPVFDETLIWLKSALEPGNLGRHSVIAEVLLFLLSYANYSSKTVRSAMIQCFKLLWSTIPVPFVTKLELQREVRRRFAINRRLDWEDFHELPIYYNFRAIPDSEQQFMSLCEYYDDVYPCEPVLCKPRSLRQLCKCNVRAQLSNNFNLPNGVDDLPLPPRIKSYVLLKNVI